MSLSIAYVITEPSRRDKAAQRIATSQERIQIWSDALQEFRGAPLFGIGRDQFRRSRDWRAHTPTCTAWSSWACAEGSSLWAASSMP